MYGLPMPQPLGPTPSTRVIHRADPGRTDGNARSRGAIHRVKSREPGSRAVTPRSAAGSARGQPHVGPDACIMTCATHIS